MLFRVCDYYFLTHPEVAPYVNHAHFERFFLLHLFGSEGVWLAIIAAALWLRRRSPHNRLLVHFTVQYYVIGMSLATYFFGTYTSNMAGTVLMGGAAIAFLLFDRGPVLGAMASGLAVLIGTTIGAQTGLIPYAPMMVGR